MAEVRSVRADKYNDVLAEALKNVKEFESPEWVRFVKSGAGKERPVNEKDFWHKRAASVLRQIYIRRIVGVERLRTKYGNRKNRGAKPPEFRKGAGKMIRVILQQSEKAGFVEIAKGKRPGRRLTEKGKEFLEKVAESFKGDKK